MNNFNFGAKPSKLDKKLIYEHELKTLAGEPELKGGYVYSKDEIEHQHKVGICTAISLTQNAKKFIGIPFSADFQYLLQKKYYDGNWDEGSSILNALKVGKNIGFLPLSEWKWTTEQDRYLPYDAYIAKLKSIPETEIERLKLLCADYKLDGYSFIDPNDNQAIARSINNSKAGILCMYQVGEEWYTPSWLEKDINPLKAPKKVVSGHAITMSSYNYTLGIDQVLANTWGDTWCKSGCADINWLNYKPRECWIPYYKLTETQLKDLKNTLQSKITLMMKVVDLLKKLKLLKK